MHKWIHQIEEARQAIFVGFFGPIGVSAVFYLTSQEENQNAKNNEAPGRDDGVVAKVVPGQVCAIPQGYVWPSWHR
jgi:NhaP-type Na+/H+ or K+/H+ antiporter